MDGSPFTGADEAWAAALTGTEGPLSLTIERAASAGDGDGAPTPQTLLLTLADADEATRQAILDDTVLSADTRSPALQPQPGSPAAAAGIQPGDQPIRMGDVRIETWDDFLVAVQDQAVAGEPLAITLLRRGAANPLQIPVEVQVTPVAGVTDLGFTPQVARLREVYQEESFGGAVKAGFVSSVDLIKQLYVTLKRLFTGDVAASNLGGIITISRVTYQVAQWGPARYFYFLALLSINLAFLNLLPIPVLDGGHILFLLIEKVKGSPVSPRVFQYSQVMGLVFVLALVVFVTYNDLLKVFRD